MPGTASLKLELTDVLNHDLNDTVLIQLTNTRSSCRYRIEERVRRTLALTGIAFSPAAVYRVCVAPEHYRQRQFFVSLSEENPAAHRLAFPVNPKRVRCIEGPDYPRLPAQLRRIVAEDEFDALTDTQGACLFNITAKAAATVLSGGKNCLDFWDCILRVRQDRLLARSSAALEEEVAASGLFQRRNGLLHRPPAGYRRTASYKTKDAHGNLQLTFFRRGESGDDYLVDADIDEARGLEHLFEVVRNRLRGPTNPYDVREVLIAGQSIDPGYRFLLT